MIRLTLLMVACALCLSCEAEDNFCLSESLETVEGVDVSYSCDEAEDGMVCTCIGGVQDGETFQVDIACGFAQDDGRGDVHDRARDFCIPFEDEE